MLRCLFYAWISMAAMAFLPASGPCADLQSGFGGIAWGTAMEQVGDCEKVGQNGDIVYCGRRNRAHAILDQPVQRVTYGFYKNGLFAVFVRIENDSLFSQVQDRLVVRLGPPEQQLNAQGGVTKMVWLDGKVRTEMTDDTDEQGFKLAFYYRPVFESLAADSGALFPARRSKAKLFPIGKGDLPDAVRILEF